MLKAAVDEEKAFTEKKKAFQDANSRRHRPHHQGRGQEPAAAGQGRRDPEGMEQVA
ncbi:MAG: hypothetical protein M0C28_46710 [Candidatus Moduliflexus flocculans]|nr:hypothetical protein [Candidatus Moduliflexus flocculans]